MSIPLHNDNQNPPEIRPFNNPDRSPLRDSSLDDKAHIFIALVVVVPIIFTVILCIIIYCIYRFRKPQIRQNSSMTPIGRRNVAISTIFYNPQHNPIIFEDLPPSYDLISETKKDLQFTTTSNNTNEQLQLTPIKNETTLTTNTPPPSYSDYTDANK